MAGSFIVKVINSDENSTLKYLTIKNRVPQYSPLGKFRTVSIYQIFVNFQNFILPVTATYCTVAVTPGCNTEQ